MDITTSQVVQTIKRIFNELTRKKYAASLSPNISRADTASRLRILLASKTKRHWETLIKKKENASNKILHKVRKEPNNWKGSYHSWRQLSRICDSLNHRCSTLQPRAPGIRSGKGDRLSPRLPFFLFHGQLINAPTRAPAALDGLRNCHPVAARYVPFLVECRMQREWSWNTLLRCKQLKLLLSLRRLCRRCVRIPGSIR